MADQPQSPVGKLIAQETEQQRVERVRVGERKRHAALTTEALKQRFGVE
jgi:hypothetical protein